MLKQVSSIGTWLVFVLSLCLVGVPETSWGGEVSSQEANEPRDSVTITGELGFLDPLFHKVQFGNNGTYFDYVDEGGQDVLFGFQRLSADFEFAEQHHAIFLYQPLRLETRVRLRRDVTVNEATFQEGETVDLLFSFPFYRASYLYDFLDDPEREVAIGASLQLRNATITFTSADGSTYRANRDVGPVPIIKFRGRTPLADSSFWFEFEADGFYAPIRYINGGDSDVEGAIVDASARLGRSFGGGLSGFVNARYLAGGGEGTSDDETDQPGGGYVKNWLHFATISLGFSYRHDL
jgi:hypothetical protein